MTATTKYRIANGVAVLSILAAARGLSTLVSESLGGRSIAPGALLLFASVVIGVVATVYRAYYKARREAPTNQQKIAVETLAKIAKDKETAQKRWHS